MAKAYGIAFHHESQTRELVIKALMPRPLFIHYAIITGEIIGHTRSALEHAAWEIVPSPIEGSTGFPVFRLENDSKKGNYTRDGLPKIAGINPAAATVIKAAQPFGPDFKSNRLYLLNELWNIDKHRLLNFCLAYPQGIQLTYIHAGGKIDDRMITVPVDVKDGAEFLRERHPGADVQVSAEVAISAIVFDGGPLNRQGVREFLLSSLHFVDNLLDDLAATI